MKFLDLFFDRRCKLCGKSITVGAVCSECDERIRSALVVRERLFDVCGISIRGVYLFDYDNADVKRLLFALKHHADSDLFLYASELYRACVPENFTGIVTCCPRGAKSRRNYGYDQVAVPLKLMCKSMSESVEFMKLLKRRGLSREQKKLNLAERRKNTRGKFRITKKDIHENILLFDDIVTTGSTVISCAEEILRECPDARLSFAFLASRGAFSGK